MKIGVTATRHGMNAVQRRHVIRDFTYHNISELHHGCCVGGDEEAHEIAKFLGGVRIVLHPPEDTKLQAVWMGDEVWEPKDYLARDRDIVDSVSRLVAAPFTNEEVMRGSGTWYTIRYARKQGIPHTIYYPNGDIHGFEP